MQLTLSTPDFVVYDDVLPSGRHAAVWQYLQTTPLRPVPQVGFAWRIGDGQPFSGPSCATWRDAEAPVPAMNADPARFRFAPTGEAIDDLLSLVAERAPTLRSWVGDDWTMLSGTGWVYPAGSAISWHADDHDRYAGAYIYYAHPRWNARWGGELMVMSRPHGEPLHRAPRFDFADYSRRLLESGVGHFVMPKPNRLVVLGGAPHMVAAVTAAAGDNVRGSIAGFFHRVDEKKTRPTVIELANSEST